MPNPTQETCLAWLAASGLPADALRDLLKAEPDPVCVYSFFRQHGKLPAGIPAPDKLLREMRRQSEEDRLMVWRQLIEKHGIRTVTSEDPGYPERLLNIPDAPAVLFYQGNLKAPGERTVSMVGSRNCSMKGAEATARISRALSESGISVISGLAYGIDAAAHQGCLRGGSPTAAVLGCGLDQDYPAENAALRKRILDAGGLVLSEYAPGEKPLGWHFPYRNRIISGLGDCVILMEARIRSGSMTTVQHAPDQGKDVFVYPGEPESLRSEGNHQLLREGAIYFTTAEDLMDDMGWLDKKIEVGQNNGSAAEQTLTAPEKQVMNQLEKGACGFDFLCDALNMQAALLNSTLSLLQIRGLIRALPGKQYQKND